MHHTYPLDNYEGYLKTWTIPATQNTRYNLSRVAKRDVFMIEDQGSTRTRSKDPNKISEIKINLNWFNDNDKETRNNFIDVPINC